MLSEGWVGLWEGKDISFSVSVVVGVKTVRASLARGGAKNHAAEARAEAAKQGWVRPEQRVGILFEN